MRVAKTVAVGLVIWAATAAPATAMPGSVAKYAGGGVSLAIVDVRGGFKYRGRHHGGFGRRSFHRGFGHRGFHKRGFHRGFGHGKFRHRGFKKGFKFGVFGHGGGKFRHHGGKGYRFYAK